MLAVVGTAFAAVSTDCKVKLPASPVSEPIDTEVVPPSPA
jgi:hypothetical protein